MLQILYLGDGGESTTSFQRAKALERLGHSVLLKDPYVVFKSDLTKKLKSAFHYHSSYKFLQKKISKWIKAIITTNYQNLDLVWVNGGELFGKNIINLIHKFIKCPIVLYNNDDPTGGRDGRRFGTLIKAIPFYDLCVVMRDINKIEYNRLGAKKVLKVTMSYDEVAHRPGDYSEDIPNYLHSEVAFIGTWMRKENRDGFLLHLLDAGIPIAIWGNRWEKSPLWSKLSLHYRGKALVGRDYVAAIQGAKIILGLLSKGNRDLHTQRSLEVPFAGGLLCAERTSEHLAMFEEGKEAVFWSNAEECASICKELLYDDARRENIRKAGMKKVRSLSLGNEDICRSILNAINNPQI